MSNYAWLPAMAIPWFNPMNGNVKRPKKRPSSKISDISETEIVIDFAALPVPDQITDIVVVEFDRALFHTPTSNLDLLSASAARLLETGLGDYSWWTSPQVLEAADKHCQQWNEPLVELLKVAAESDQVFTVVVSGRTAANEPQIKAMLASRDINVDLVVTGEANQPIRGKKAALVTGLWKYYGHARRLTVYEGRPRDARGLRNHMMNLSTPERPGLLLQEVVAPLVLLPPRVERELVQWAVEAYNATSEAPLQTEIVTQSWIFRLSESSESSLQALMAEHLPGETALFTPLKICQGDIDLDIRQRVGPRGTMSQWKVNGIVSNPERSPATVVAVLEPLRPGTSTLRPPRLPLCRSQRTIPWTEVDMILEFYVDIDRRLSLASAPAPAPAPPAPAPAPPAPAPHPQNSLYPSGAPAQNAHLGNTEDQYPGIPRDPVTGNLIASAGFISAVPQDPHAGIPGDPVTGNLIVSVGSISATRAPEPGQADQPGPETR